ncbi:MAG: PQQ-dependent dehydrogenase, methanol/ethanol family [Gammaproteobacteria bacterium]|nr:PQQ-dependent dehydrogenase, methanol/ethanol family [Gammaproteobacteria bacterium]MDH5309868.1 PQQ-dependent dehydrogenase, methanol/ethanol family [Gammaproteobacteria bacterium]
MSRQRIQLLAGAIVVILIVLFGLRGIDTNDTGIDDSPALNELASIADAEIADEARTGDWLAYGRTHSEQRFSPLTDINRSTVSDLKVAWYLDLPQDVGLVSTPLVVDGVLYFTGTMNVIRAVDATSGQPIWEYDPDVAGHIGSRRQVGWVHNRGISFYKGRIFAATWDGRLLALDAQTGELAWSSRTFDADRPLYITGAPKAFKGKVLIGNGGTEVGRSRGFVTAYDADTGAEAWKFYVVPGNPAYGFENAAMAMAAETWTGSWWEHGGGGNAWHGFTYDPEFNAVYVGTGNGSPWNRRIRSPGGGDNLFLSSIVALDADTGAYLWHYQTTPGESWDFNSSMDIVLADIEVDGKPIKAILHAPKNGFFYVIDRASGRLVSAEPFARVTWATHVDPETGRPVETPDARYEDGEAEIWPSAHGAHSWQAMSYNPVTGLVYLPTMNLGGRFVDMGLDASWRMEEFIGGTGVGLFEILVPDDIAPGMLQAWDPVKQEPAWSVPQEHPWNAGTLTTAGNLVFQGRSDGMFLAYDATTGAELWRYDLGLGISAPPITYKLDGRQYVALLVGYGGSYTMGFTPGLPDEGWAYGVHRRRLVAFALDGDASLPPQPPPYKPEPLVYADFPLDESIVMQGAMLYGTYCGICHGGGAVANAMAPDLRASAVPLDATGFAEVVREGSRANRAMPPFAALTDEELKAIRHYLRYVAHRDAGITSN